MGGIQMKRIVPSRLIPAIFAFILMLPSLSLSAQNSRIALVIGNGSYKSSPLKNPLNDANDMADVLRKLGFSVQLKINADQRSMEVSIRTFGKKLRSGGIGLFYFAGHGLQVDGRNYLIPTGADIESEADVRFEAVDAGRVLAQMEDAENSMNIIILDACRNNPFARSFRSGHKGLAKMDAPVGSILAYSTAPGSVAEDGSGRNGLYTSYILKHIKEPGLKIEDLFKKVRLGVSKESGKKQTPWESSSLMGDFYFSTKRGISVVPVAAGKPPLNESDKVLAAERRQLEKERMELYKLRAEIEERKKLDTERRRLEAERRQLEDEKHKIAKPSLESDRLPLANEKSPSKQLAYIPPTTAQVRTDPRSSLAIFPFCESSIGKMNTKEEEKFIQFVIDYTSSIPNILLTHSFYSYDKPIDNKLISIKKIIPASTKREIWYGDSRYPKKKPDYKLLHKLSKSINSNLILTFKVTHLPSTAYIDYVEYRGYLVDIEKNIYYEKRLETEGMPHIEVYALKDVTKDLFKSYLKSK
jgi:uncharacterized caspase-like protein